MLRMRTTKSSPYLSRVGIEAKDVVSVLVQYLKQSSFQPFCLLIVVAMANSLHPTAKLAHRYY